MSTSPSTVRVAVDGPVARVTMTRPDRMNAMTNTMAAEMTQVLSQIADDTSVVVMVLTGEGRGFCPGADLKQLSGGEPDAPISAAHFRSAVLLHQMPQVTIAAINGPCAGAGLGWAAACDLRYAARGARFSTAFLDRAVAGDMGLPWSLPRLIGAARARQLSFFPDKFTAMQAQEWGLVNEVFDDAQLLDQVDERVVRLAAADRAAVRTLKSNYIAAEKIGFPDFIELETSRHLELYGTDEFQAAVRSFEAGA